MDFKDEEKKYGDYVVKMRRYFHENPEVSGKEYNTSKVVKEELDKMGIPWVECGLETGVLATIKGGKPGSPNLHRPASQHDLPVKGQKHAGNAAGGHGGGAAQIVRRIGQGMHQRQLAPRQHHGDGHAAQHIGQGRGGVGHGICTVGDDDAVVIPAGLRRLPGDQLPFLRLDVGGIQREDIPAADGAAGHIVQALPHKLRGRQLRLQPVFPRLRSDGAAGGQN